MATKSSVDLELAAQLRLLLTRTARRLRQEAGSELGPAQAAVLATLERGGPLAPSELASRERIKRPTATRIVARLTELGLVERTPDPEDGRCALVSITPEGRSLLRRLRNRKTAYLAKRLAELDPEDVRTLEAAAGVLERMLAEDGEEQ